MSVGRHCDGFCFRDESRVCESILADGDATTLIPLFSPVWLLIARLLAKLREVDAFKFEFRERPLILDERLHLRNPLRLATSRVARKSPLFSFEDFAQAAAINRLRGILRNHKKVPEEDPTLVKALLLTQISSPFQPNFTKRERTP
jgi:hypothetical protein